MLDQTPADSRTKFYNTWSCRGFLTEGMVPIQVARGSHEDQNIPGTYLLRNGQTLVSKEPSVRTVANSWVPCENIKGKFPPQFRRAHSARRGLQHSRLPARPGDRLCAVLVLCLRLQHLRQALHSKPACKCRCAQHQS